MAAESGLAMKQNESSPFEQLNVRFSQQNDLTEELISKLTNSLHKLSDTNTPKGDPETKTGISETIFREGHLMNMYCQLNRQERLNQRLYQEVSKLESLAGM